MPTLRETKTRIAAVRSTLKITGAMKLVASTRLQKAQRRIAAMLPYEQALERMMKRLPRDPRFYGGDGFETETDGAAGVAGNGFEGLAGAPAGAAGKVAVIAVASDNSLCGSFNHNVIRSALDQIEALGGGADGAAGVSVIPIGKKMSEALRRAGIACDEFFAAKAAEPAYEDARSLADAVVGGFLDGRYSRVVLVYTHFISTSSQKVAVEQFLPLATGLNDTDETAGATSNNGEGAAPEQSALNGDEGIIIEPGKDELAARLMPEALRVKLFSVLLDSSASEHAARTMAMQAATENAEDLLGALTLDYNKARQQKITSEILDLMNN